MSLNSISRNSCQSFFNCPLCFEKVPDEEQNSHLSFGCKKLYEFHNTDESYSKRDDSSDSYLCPLCLKEMRMSNKKYHESFECEVLIENTGLNEVVLEQSPSYADVMKKKHLCSENCPCKKKSDDCVKCKNTFPSNKFLEHAKNCPGLKKKCDYCQEMIDSNCEEIHKKFCPALKSKRADVIPVGSVSLASANDPGPSNASSLTGNTSQPSGNAAKLPSSFILGTPVTASNSTSLASANGTGTSNAKSLSGNTSLSSSKATGFSFGTPVSASSCAFLASANGTGTSNAMGISGIISQSSGKAAKHPPGSSFGTSVTATSSASLASANATGSSNAVSLSGNTSQLSSNLAKLPFSFSFGTPVTASSSTSLASASGTGSSDAISLSGNTSQLSSNAAKLPSGFSFGTSVTASTDTTSTICPSLFSFGSSNTKNKFGNSTQPKAPYRLILNSFCYEEREKKIKGLLKNAQVYTCEATQYLSADISAAILRQQLKSLLLDSENHDVILKVKDEEFKAHKYILGARSPVFARMFTHNMKEKESGEVTVDDCEPKSFGKFLEYIYTGMVESLTCRSASELYYASDKYNVPDLKELCIEYLMNNMSVTSICDVLTLATSHGENELLDRAIAFFCRNLDDILITVEWQNYLVRNPIQANELYIKASKNLQIQIKQLKNK